MTNRQTKCQNGYEDDAVDGPRFVCSFVGCGKTLASRGSLTDHIKRHLGIKDHVCPHCEKAFVAKAELRRHMRVHTGEKPFECKHCRKRFSLQSNMRKHERKHEKM